MYARAICLTLTLILSACGEPQTEPLATARDIQCDNVADLVAHTVTITCENGRRLVVPYPAPPPSYITTVENERPGVRCEFGGSVIASGYDYDEDGALSVQEVDDLAFVCASNTCS